MKLTEKRWGCRASTGSEMLEKYTRYLRYRRKLGSFELILSHRRQATSEIFFHAEKSPCHFSRSRYCATSPPNLLGDTHLLTSRVTSLARLELIRRYLRWVDAPTDCMHNVCIMLKRIHENVIYRCNNEQTQPMHYHCSRVVGKREWDWRIFLISILNPFVGYKFLYTPVRALMCKTKRKWSSFHVHGSNYEYFPPASTFASFKITVYLSRTNVISNQRSFRFWNTRVFDSIIYRDLQTSNLYKHQFAMSENAYHINDSNFAFYILWDCLACLCGKILFFLNNKLSHIIGETRSVHFLKDPSFSRSYEKAFNLYTSGLIIIIDHNYHYYYYIWCKERCNITRDALIV